MVCPPPRYRLGPHPDPPPFCGPIISGSPPNPQQGPVRLGRSRYCVESNGHLAPAPSPHHELPGRLVQYQSGEGHVPICATHPDQKGDFPLQTMVV